MTCQSCESLFDLLVATRLELCETIATWKHGEPSEPEEVAAARGWRYLYEEDDDD